MTHTYKLTPTLLVSEFMEKFSAYMRAYMVIHLLHLRDRHHNFVYVFSTFFLLLVSTRATCQVTLSDMCTTPTPLLAVPNVTAHPSTASVPVTVLLYDGPLLCSFNVAINGLMERHISAYFTPMHLCGFVCTVKCEPKAMLVGCNAGITAIDMDLDVSDFHCSTAYCMMYKGKGKGVYSSS